jgi:shikimate dehydrogenase
VGENSINYEAVDETVINEHQLIINASPVGTFPNIDQAPDLPYPYLSIDHVLYDLIYNPPETRFLKEGKTRGCKILNGQKMLVYQAEKSWDIWNQ